MRLKRNPIEFRLRGQRVDWQPKRGLFRKFRKMSDRYDWIGARECARLCGINRGTLHLWHKLGIGPPHWANEETKRICRRYLRHEVLAWLQKQRRQG